MPRLSAATPKYRKHRASGQAIVTIQERDHYLGPYGSRASKVEYDRLVGEWLVAGRPSGPLPTPSAITTTEVIAAFRRFAKPTTVGGASRLERPTITSLPCPGSKSLGHTPAAGSGPRLEGSSSSDGRRRPQPPVHQRQYGPHQRVRWAVSDNSFHLP
jgi:hypothetical protein